MLLSWIVKLGHCVIKLLVKPADLIIWTTNVTTNGWMLRQILALTKDFTFSKFNSFHFSKIHSIKLSIS